MLDRSTRLRMPARCRAQEAALTRSYVLGPARLALGDGTLQYGRLVIDNGYISDILGGDGPSDFGLPAFATIAPGMIDVHTNGAADTLFNRDQGAAVASASTTYAAQGATGFVATIMTAPWESMLHAGGEVAEAAHVLAEQQQPTGARCLGIHFEGPFLNPKFRRVHRGEWLLDATIERANALIEASRGTLVLATMAPEVDGVGEVARFFYDQGIVCAAGHTAAKYRDGMLAIGLGFRTLTHAFNGMAPLDHRDPSILAAFIQEPRTTVQVICDGYHVAPVMIDILYRTLGERLVLATRITWPRPAASIASKAASSARKTARSPAARCIATRPCAISCPTPRSRSRRRSQSACAAPARLLGIERERGTIARGQQRGPIDLER